MCRFSLNFEVNFLSHPKNVSVKNLRTLKDNNSDPVLSTQRESRPCECTRAVLIFLDLQRFCHILHRRRRRARARPGRWTGNGPHKTPPEI